MSYTRERKVTSIVKDFLVWLPQGSDLPLDAGIADSASLAEAGLCSAEELRRLRLELHAANQEIKELGLARTELSTAKAELAQATAESEKLRLSATAAWEKAESWQTCSDNMRAEAVKARQEVRARDADIFVLKDALKTAQDTREGAVRRADGAEQEAKALRTDILAIAEVLGVVYEVDGHNSVAGPIKDIVAQARKANEAWEKTFEPAPEYAVPKAVMERRIEEAVSAERQRCKHIAMSYCVRAERQVVDTASEIADRIGKGD